jgi:hypothetical protein
MLILGKAQPRLQKYARITGCSGVLAFEDETGKSLALVGYEGKEQL